MDNKKASCIFYVKVGTFTQAEQSKISLLTANTSGVVKLTIQRHLIVSLRFTLYPGDYLRQSSSDVLSLKQYPINI
jgi:hypothetical protein